ncbi:hypothetical protein [Sphingomonas sp. NIBR02145]|uniref:hypothetical protein n=1 Tax=Sphingomonas sp. NIBR02145 TaxID=3014784 RepID=UPI0022B307A2|nr:hypothetical protein [Sphingomonas sp. NIBR02145]WHU05019.1 hypothetical protein O3305_10640 [Sphingomonas sp. NIBR02145]
MSVLDQVRRLIERLSPEPICDDCIASRLELNGDEPVEQHTHELVGAHGFERRIDACSLCGEVRKVTRSGSAKTA